MNKIITLIAAAFATVLLSGSATAQSYNLTSAVTGGTNNIAASATNTTTYGSSGYVIPVTKSQYVGVQASFKLQSTATTNCTFYFDRSVDGSVWEQYAHTLVVTPVGSTSTVVTAAASITVGGYGYLRLSKVVNPNDGAMTNIVVKYSQKTGI